MTPARCPQCARSGITTDLRFTREEYRNGWHFVDIDCPRCGYTIKMQSGKPRCPWCGAPLDALHRHTGGDNGIWVDAGYQCANPNCRQSLREAGRRIWTRVQLEGFYRQRTRTDKKHRADERRARKADRLRASLPEV